MNKIVLKPIIKDGNKSIVVISITGLFLLLYFISSAFYIGSPGYFLLSSIDSSIPYLPWTSFIYIMMYPLLFWVFYELKDNTRQNKLFYAFIFLTVISNLIFIIYPVSYPREFFPTPYDNTPGVNLLRTIRFLDKPVNCFPSLHVSSLFLFTYSLWDQSKKKFAICLVFSTLISISTMTTKQHYFMDAVAGFVLATTLYIFFWKVVEIKKEI